MDFKPSRSPWIGGFRELRGHAIQARRVLSDTLVCVTTPCIICISDLYKLLAGSELFHESLMYVLLYFFIAVQWSAI